MNVFSCEGRIVQDAELRTTNNGTQVAGFRLASNVGYGDNQTTLWLNCSLWGQRAEKVANSLKKGQQVMINGELSLREYQRNDGTSGSSLELRVNDFAYGKGGEAAGGQGGGYGGEDQTKGQGAGDMDDEIPF